MSFKKLAIILLGVILMGNVRYTKHDIIIPQVNHYVDNIEQDERNAPEAFELDMSKVSNDYNYQINLMAEKLKIPYIDLFSVMAYETGGKFDPKSKNPISGAMGLLQFTNQTATTLVNRQGKHFKNVAQLIEEYPTVKDQMELPTKDNKIGGPVYQYLARNAPYANKRELYLTVFRPTSVNDHNNKSLPNIVRQQNPGLNKVGDYEKKVNEKIKLSNKVIAD